MVKDSAGAAGGPAKKHVSTACQWCRNRKVKTWRAGILVGKNQRSPNPRCDGNTPSCSNCVSAKQACEYDYTDKRKHSHKASLQQLRARVQLLENLLESHGIRVPPDTSSNAAPASQPGPQASNVSPYEHSRVQQNQSPNDWQREQLGNDNPRSKIGQAPSLQAHGWPLEDVQLRTSKDLYSYGNMNGKASGAFEMIPTQIPEDFMLELDSSIFQYEMSKSLGLPSGYRGANLKDKAHSNLNEVAVTDDDGIIDQLSARVGAFQLAEDGQLRYFGATSNLHILRDGLPSFSRSNHRSVRLDGEEALRHAGLDQHISPELETYLEELYFRWEDPAIHVVDEDMYFQTKNIYNSGHDGSPFYSETLKNAICAIGSSLTSRQNIGLPKDASVFFGDRAKILLDIEMDCPLVATVQALVIMSAIEAAATNDARGWLYSGMAVRLSADLGLHLDLTDDVQKGILSTREMEARRTTFWGVYIHDNMWSLYVGRPWGINTDDISISRPSNELDRVKSKTWTSTSASPQSPSDPDKSPIHHYDPIEACSDANVSLCSMMRQLSKTVYSPRPLSESKLQTFAENMNNEFMSWIGNLPEELQVDLSNESKIYLPHVLQLHMQFHAISILLYRPFFSRGITKTPSMFHRDGEDPRAICVESAQSIIQLVRLYRKQHTLRRTNVHIVHLLFTASLICVYNTCTDSGLNGGSSLADFQFCCQALGEIGQAYQNATRALEVIICIKRDWFNKSRRFPRRNKRGSVAEHDAEASSGRKRRLTENPSPPSQMNSMWLSDITPAGPMLENVASQPFQVMDSTQFEPGDGSYIFNDASMLDYLFASTGGANHNQQPTKQFDTSPQSFQSG